MMVLANENTSVSVYSINIKNNQVMRRVSNITRFEQLINSASFNLFSIANTIPQTVRKQLICCWGFGPRLGCPEDNFPAGRKTRFDTGRINDPLKLNFMEDLPLR